MPRRTFENRTFVVLLIFASIAFVWLLLPFYGAVFWAVILAILFNPLHRRLKVWCGRRRNLAAFLSLLFCVLLAVIPVITIAASLIQEVAMMYQLIRQGDIDFGRYLAQIHAALPEPILEVLRRFGLTDLENLRRYFSDAMRTGSQMLANQALSVGQNTFQFMISFAIMLYLLFFLFRDGADLARRIVAGVPLQDHRKIELFQKFTTVVRATVKGNVVVAITQGVLGGLIFWVMGIHGALLWGVIMAFLSLLPAVGAGLVWGPVAMYFMATGAMVEGVFLALYGIFVIGLVDNVLRPILVGKDTKLPDYLVLISTLGGLALFGLNGFVIGPLIAAIFISSWAIFIRDTRNEAEVALVEGELKIVGPEEEEVLEPVAEAAEGKIPRDAHFEPDTDSGKRGELGTSK